MTTFQIIIEDIDQVKSEKCRRSDVYNSIRVIIENQYWLKTILVCIKGEAAKEFPADTDTLIIANHINDTTIKKQMA